MSLLPCRTEEYLTDDAASNIEIEKTEGEVDFCTVHSLPLENQRWANSIRTILNRSSRHHSMEKVGTSGGPIFTSFGCGTLVKIFGIIGMRIFRFLSLRE